MSFPAIFLAKNFLSPLGLPGAKEELIFPASVIHVNGSTILVEINGFILRATTTVSLQAGSKILLRYRGQSSGRIVLQIVAEGEKSKTHQTDSRLQEEANSSLLPLSEPSNEDKNTTSLSQAATCFFLLPHREKYIPVYLQFTRKQEKNCLPAKTNSLSLLLSLYPPTLGPIQARLTLRENHLLCAISVADEKSRVFLNSFLPLLKEKLVQTGLKITLPPVRLLSPLKKTEEEETLPGIDLEI